MKHTRCILALLALPLFNLAQTPLPAPMTNQHVIELSRSGLRADQLSRMIGTAPNVYFILIPEEEEKLRRAGVADETILMMSARQNGQVLLNGKIRTAGDTRPRVFVADSPNAWSADVTYRWQYLLTPAYGAGSHPQLAERS